MRLPKIIRSQSFRRLAITSLLVLGLSPFFQLGQFAKAESSSFVKIKNRNWGKCLNLQSNATQNGGLPNVWDCVSHPDQEWKIE
ncbi:RICIN domain-containing protein, partial [Pseudanabaena sp. UWO311]|uniref:RICIN domain-containing protein n=1 Tax=Pseudanabaena sp. UWO311 TaxID=2487337 RepID=UPI001680E53B